ncbi:Uma2 family endonuclease [Desulfonatronum thioautotrophicum]|uniref:Uma2 family endonuclease n=1 Tax=Desulfonatronum thioautotrophicum TaxID=617001 RepID=UPI0009FE2F3A|nr:Uma2 family endonuclease [Desulfonatronum thioautotrophicum]
MGRAQPVETISVQDYLAGELESNVRHEYIDGAVYAMVGASDRHGLIAGNLFAALRPHVRGTPCQLFITDMKVCIQLKGQTIFYYPDLILSCDPGDRHPYFRTSPCMIVEVLSASTRRVDQQEKLAAYITLPSLREYLLIDQDRMLVRVHRRSTEWEGQTITAGGVRFACLNVELPLETIYEDVPFPSPGADLARDHHAHAYGDFSEEPGSPS